jgi:hypothetical protein
MSVIASGSDDQRLSCKKAIEILSRKRGDEPSNVDLILGDLTSSDWLSDEEFARFFVEVSNNIYEESEVGGGSGVNLFGREITYSFYPGTAIWGCWVKARKIRSTVERQAEEMECLPPTMTSIFNIIPAAYAADYNNQSLDTWLASEPTGFTHEDNEFFCTLIAVAEEYSLSPLEDIVRNIRSTPVLNELVFCSPELICSDEYLLGSNLLDNPALSEEALIYLASLFLQIELPPDFSGKTQGDLGVVSVGADDVSTFWINCVEECEALNKHEIASLISQHPKCTEFLREQISRVS